MSMISTPRNGSNGKLSFEGEPSRTKQAFKEDCDINRIMRKYKKTGVIDHLAPSRPSYGDFESSADYQLACNQVIAAEDAFAELPSHIRDRMDNDPGKLLDFINDPSNAAEAFELGLTSVSPAPPPAEPGPDPQGESASGETTPPKPS